ncbi:unnamed protein product [Menidia menidia]|uniref:(Atlantic silverside) hypothetical protein n=1 Tax=Menidia menidia TaxID=238744 RepID=A0A8S4B7J2_9TELE|nr:unnamed protein product [Menidia menidia]
MTVVGQKYSLDNEKILLRGCTLRNTHWCFGLVLFGGPETKLMQNCGKSTFKRTSVDRLMNVLVLCIFGFLAFMCTVLAIGNYIWQLQEGSEFTAFLEREDGNSPAFSSFLTFWSYIIILNTVVPISLYVSHRQSLPHLQADLLLLSSSEPLNLVYIETAELDGETNLKVRQALPVTGDLGDDIEKLADFNGEVHCEPPNNRLDRFTGTLTVVGQKYSLDNEKILLRGCTLRNTHWCFGLVLFGGPETKLMQNCGKSTFKRTSVDRLMNVLVLCIFGFLAFMCTVLAIGNYIWQQQEGSEFTAFLEREDGNSPAFSSFLTFWSYIIILNTVVPISLYVSVEIIRLGNSFYIDWDRKMYFSRSDTPAEARTTTLNEELGQIKYVFSDKTGTLTQNIMVFNKCSINGKSYGDVYDYTGQRLEISEHRDPVDFSFNPLADPRFLFFDHSLVEAVKMENPEVHAFFRLLALCHTAMAEEKKEGELLYQAQSPDEGALVTAARNFGFVFRSRTPDSISIVEMGRQQTYELLAILDFNNVRKRMSVIGI